jgi:hypothetical protein
MAQAPNNFFAENIFTRPPITPIGGTGGGIEIPGIRVGASKGEVMGTLDFYQTDTWKSLNPKIFIFMPKKRRQKRNNPGHPMYVSPRPSRMVHPVHLTGSNVKWWGGIPRFNGPFGEDGNAIILRHTEFVLPTTVPYTWFNLNNMGLDPYEWCTYENLNTQAKRQTVSADFPVPSGNLGEYTSGDPYRVSLGRRGAYSNPLGAEFSNQKKKFKFAIVIDNPNATVDSPYLIGPMSDSIVLRFRFTSQTDPVSGLQLYDLAFTPDHISRVIS